MTRLATVLVCLLAPSAAAFAQGAPPPQGTTGGPMLVQEVRSGLLFAPEYRVSDVDSSAEQLAGGYAGVMIDNTLFIGGGGYGLVSDSGVRGMAYGGVMVGWSHRTNRLFGFGARGLAGFGAATLDESFRAYPGPFGHHGPCCGPFLYEVRSTRDFFVAEPQGSLLINFSGTLRLNVGVGYRLIAGADEANDRLRGVTGSVSFEVGGSSTRTLSKP